MRGASPCRACSRPTESIPPDSPTATRFPRMDARTDLSTFSSFLEAAMGHQALEALFDQLFRFLVFQQPVRLGERLLERRAGGLRIAMRAAGRLWHDLVDQAEGFQAVGGDA